MTTVNINWATVGATVAALAGAAGTIITPIFGTTLATDITGILQGLSALLLVIPTWHVTSVAATNAKESHAAKVAVAQEAEMIKLRNQPAPTGPPNPQAAAV
jgi:hypothetical protein